MRTMRRTGSTSRSSPDTRSRRWTRRRRRRSPNSSSGARKRAGWRRISDGRRLQLDPGVVEIVEVAIHTVAVPPILQMALLMRQADGARLERADAFAAGAADARIGDAAGA